MLRIKKLKICSNIYCFRILSIIATLVWMSIIYFLSSQSGIESSDLSSGITEAVVQIIIQSSPTIKLDESLVETFMRSIGHFSLYFVLGVLVFNSVYRKRKTKIYNFLIASSISILYAISDELHQLYVDNRAAEVIDIIIDSFGVIIGISIYILLLSYIDFKKSRKHIKD